MSTSLLGQFYVGSMVGNKTLAPVGIIYAVTFKGKFYVSKPL